MSLPDIHNPPPQAQRSLAASVSCLDRFRRRSGRRLPAGVRG
eukprot:CAMPEP_0184234852 /NCGR_PEP_ID=MMETSP0976-20121227/25020_1 /TAXON_ID=483370 /ORGANISM="non described non described, Strain CCMP2097" /LENGTH=41 /DNA_ID= /DNA_START= /DNA_END= /DNA_ORIENTATION=